MKIGIIGAGNVGGSLAANWASKGHEIFLGVRNPESRKSDWENQTNVSVHTAKEAADLSDVIVIALPIPTLVDVIKSLGSLEKKVIIDATNSVFGKPDPYKTGYHALLDLTNADVAKGFNTTGWENMVDPLYDGEGVDMFTAGDSEKAKKVVKQLSKDAGFGNCYDFGGEDKVELIEQFAMCWINLAIMQGEGRNIAFKVLKR